jgi:4-aminobutyrate--pyruvate transaminase
VICGFWRTGNYWGSQSFDIEPDILVCAKALSAAYMPISAVMVNDRVYQGLADESHKIGTFGHGYTYSGHPVAAAVAIETLKIYDEIDIGAHVQSVGPHLQSELQRRFGGHKLIGDIRGIGLIGAIELVADKQTHQNFDPALKIGPRFVKLVESHGVIGRALPSDALAFSPPLIITRDEVDQVLDRVEAALAEFTTQLEAEGVIG